MAEVKTENEGINNGKANVMGINIDISQVLGDKIIDQYLAQLSEEDIEKVMDYISADLFTKKYDGSLEVNMRDTDNLYNYNRKKPIAVIIKERFNEKIKDELLKKVDEIIATTDYQDKVEKIAQELVDYATEGYKEDMKNRIRERLVNNVVDPTPYYGGINLSYIIQQEIEKYIHR